MLRPILFLSLGYKEPRPSYFTPQGHFKESQDDKFPIRHETTSIKKKKKSGCCSSFLTGLVITLVVLSVLAITTFFLFPRIPTFQLLDFQQLTPNDGTLKLLPDASALKFFIEYKSKFFINSTNYIPWTFSPILISVMHAVVDLFTFTFSSLGLL